MTRLIIERPAIKESLFMAKRKRVCAYVRVSTGHEAQLDSLENQTQYYAKKISSRYDYEFVGIFSDAGISGAKESRPGFQQMMDLSRKGKIDLILTKSLSRFARNTVLLLKCVRELKSLGVAVEFEKEQINTLASEGEFLLSILASVAEEERKSVSSNIKWSFRNRYKLGDAMIDPNRLLGYDKDENGEIVVIEEQAIIVRRIFDLYLSGHSSYQIAELSNIETRSLHIPKRPCGAHSHSVFFHFIFFSHLKWTIFLGCRSNC